MNYRNNFILRKLRYALNLKERDIKNIFLLDDFEIDEEKIKQFMEKEESPMFRELNDDTLERFLNGLITFKRGKKEDSNYQKTRKKGKVLLPETSRDKGFK